MTHTLTVTILQRTYHLSIYPPRIVLIHPPIRLRLEKPVRGPPSHVLHDENDLIFGLYCLVKLRDVRVVEALHELDLAADGLLPLDLLHLLFQVDLQSDFLVRLFVHTDVDDRVGSLTDLLPDDIVVQGGLCRKDYYFLGGGWLGRARRDRIFLFIHWDDIHAYTRYASCGVARRGFIGARHYVSHASRI